MCILLILFVGWLFVMNTVRKWLLCLVDFWPVSSIPTLNLDSHFLVSSGMKLKCSAWSLDPGDANRQVWFRTWQKRVSIPVHSMSLMIFWFWHSSRVTHDACYIPRGYWSLHRTWVWEGPCESCLHKWMGDCSCLQFLIWESTASQCCELRTRVRIRSFR